MSNIHDKNYLLFEGEDFYPLGGWDDFSCSFSDLETAKNSVEFDELKWAHIVDAHTMHIICKITKWGWENVEHSR